MIPIPKPRGFWDYALFAFLMTGVLMVIFWLDASDGVGLADLALAFTAAVLLVVAIILARRNENPKWVVRPTWLAYALSLFGASALMLGALYADVYLLHRRSLTPSGLHQDAVIAVVVPAALLWSWRKRIIATR